MFFRWFKEQLVNHCNVDYKQEHPTSLSPVYLSKLKAFIFIEILAKSKAL